MGLSVETPLHLLPSCNIACRFLTERYGSLTGTGVIYRSANRIYRFVYPASIGLKVSILKKERLNDDAYQMHDQLSARVSDLHGRIFFTSFYAIFENDTETARPGLLSVKAMLAPWTSDIALTRLRPSPVPSVVLLFSRR